MKIKVIALILTILGLISCEQKDETSGFNDKPVIEGYLKVGEPLFIKIKHQITFDQTASFKVDDIGSLKVYVKKDNEIHLLRYYGRETFGDSTLIVEQGATYELSFNYGDMKVYASTTVLTKPVGLSLSDSVIEMSKIDLNQGPGSGGMPEFPDPVKVSWINTDNSYYLVLAENIETNPEEVFERSAGEEVPEIQFRIEPSQTSTTEINAFQFAYFGRYRITLYHMNADYAALFNQNNNTSQNLTSPSSNITNGEGIFTSMSSDTVYLTLNKK